MNVNINVFNKNSNIIKDKNSLNITITLIQSTSTQQNINKVYRKLKTKITSAVKQHSVPQADDIVIP